MKSVLSLIGYMFAGLSGLGLAAYLATLVMGTSFASPSSQKRIGSELELVNPSNSLHLEEQNSILIAQVEKVEETVSTAPVIETPGTSSDDDILVEGQKKNQIQKLETLKNSFDYTPKGKRDPFAAYEAPRSVVNASKPFGPVQPLQKFAINQLNVKGIIWGVDDPIAMVVTPDDQVHYVREREKIGSNNGYVAQIREGEIVIVESFMFRGNITSQVKVLPLSIESTKN